MVKKDNDSETTQSKGSVSRRGFLKGAAAGAALAAGGGTVVGAPLTAQAQTDEGGETVGTGDLRLVNGRFVDGRGEVATAISIRDGRIVAVGQPTGSGPAHTINLGGRTAIPGLIDAHAHFSRTGTNVGYEARFIEVAFSIAELQEVIAERAETVPPGPPPEGGVITADRGWTPQQFAEARLPTRDELNAAAPEHAVYLNGRTNDLGAAFFAQFGITTDANGQVSSTSAAIDALRSIQTFEDKVRGTADLISYAAEVGITSVHDVGNVNTQPGDLPPQIVREDHAVMNALYHRSGRSLNTRIRQSLLSFTITPDELDRYILNPIIREAGDEFMRVNGIGEQFGSPDDFEENLRLAARRQWRIKQHFGPADIQFDAFRTVASEFDVSDLRWSWEHVGTIRGGFSPPDVNEEDEEQMRIFAETGIGVTVWRGSPVRSWIDTGNKVGAMTDSTNVAWLNPWMQIYLYTTRRNQQDNLVLDGQQISRLRALQLYTEDSAWFSREDHELGSFEVGKKADLVVLNNDFLNVSDEQLRKTRSLLTLLGGRAVHAAGEFSDLAPDGTQPFPDRFPESIEL